MCVSMDSNLEIDFERAKELAKAGNNFFVLANDSNNLELVREVLGVEGAVHGVDMEETKQILFGEDAKKLLEKRGEAFRDAVIVCPHGRTSLRFANLLSEMGIRAYSLKGGIEGLKGRA